VHWRVQILAKNRSDAGQNKWKEATDRVAGEYRGSTLIERYIEPQDSRIPDYATNTAAEPLDKYYRWRVVSTRPFRP
jgi:hypothetical protein